MSKQTTFGQTAIKINKVKLLASQKGYEPASTSKAVQCSKCPTCHKPSLVHLVEKGQDYRDMTVGVIGVCFNLYSDDKCPGQAWVRRPEPKEVSHE